MLLCGQSTYINCETSINNDSINWFITDVFRMILGGDVLLFLGKEAQ